MTKSRTLHCSVVTPEATIFDGPTVSVVFPAYDGEMGILPHHAPLLSKVGIGVLRVVTAEGETRRLYVDGGFAQVGDNKLSLLTEQASTLDKLDPEKVAGLFEKAQVLEATTDAEFEAREAAYQRARVQRRLTRRG